MTMSDGYTPCVSIGKPGDDRRPTWYRIVNVDMYEFLFCAHPFNDGKWSCLVSCNGWLLHSSIHPSEQAAVGNLEMLMPEIIERAKTSIKTLMAPA
jgi:hypothetical protein